MKNKKIKKNIPIIIAIVLIVAGLAMMLYPYICQYIYSIQANQIISDYEQRLEEYTASQDEDESWDWLYEQISEYNNELYLNGQAGLTDVFSYQQVDFSLKSFGFDEEMIGYLNIPKMDIELPIYLGASKANLNKGAAQLTQTSLPVGGINTNSVIAAHRGMGTKAMFRNIESLELGDKVYITNFKETLTYQVAEIAVIDPSDIEAILIQEGRDLVTLITCHPYRNNYQRYVVYCERTPGKSTDEQSANGGGLSDIFRYNELTESQQLILLEQWILIIILFLLILVVVILIFKRKRAKKRESDS